MKNRITIGLSSILLILLILCLSVFSLLSLNDAKTALSFAERRADSVKAWYEADSAGQEFLHELAALTDGGGLLADSGGLTTDSDGLPADGAAPLLEAASQAARTLEERTGKTAAISAGESGSVTTSIPMPSGRSLLIELDGVTARVLSYYVYNSEEYEIDDRLPVWDGSPK